MKRTGGFSLLAYNKSSLNQHIGTGGRYGAYTSRHEQLGQNYCWWRNKTRESLKYKGTSVKY